MTATMIVAMAAAPTTTASSCCMCRTTIFFSFLGHVLVSAVTVDVTWCSIQKGIQQLY
jgi:hypothetical protein